jgi:4-phytase/acid phosphatase
VIKHLRTAALFLAGWTALAAPPPAAPPPQLRYVIIVTRHGVRSPSWTPERLNKYAAQPWPDFGVPPGYLTPHGRTLMQLMGAYYRAWLTGEHLLVSQGCPDADRIYIHADTDERTLETGRALADALAPDCQVPVHSETGGSKDPLFDPLESGDVHPDWEAAARAVRQRIGNNPQRFVDAHRPAFAALRAILSGDSQAPSPLNPPDRIEVSVAKSVRLNEEWNLASTLSEDLLLEYTNGFSGKDLGWGRLDVATLLHVMELHSAHSDLTRRTPYLARARGSNLLDHLLQSMEQAVTGKASPGALGNPGAAMLLVVGHDTNLSNLSGMLGLSWHLPGYQPDDTPPGGALIFSLWQQPETRRHSVRTQYVAQTLAQMHDAVKLTLAAPPAGQEVTPVGCDPASASVGCPWETFSKTVRAAIDPSFVAHR